MHEVDEHIPDGELLGKGKLFARKHPKSQPLSFINGLAEWRQTSIRHLIHCTNYV